METDTEYTNNMGNTGSAAENDNEERQESAPLEPDDVIDLTDKLRHGDKPTMIGLGIALAFYAAVIAVTFVGRYLVTKHAVKAAIREDRRR